MFGYFLIDHYSDEALLAMAFVLISGGFVIGYITDGVLADRGFGPAGNGFLAILGCFTGIYVRNAFFGHMYGHEMAMTGVTAALGATVMLLSLGIAKHWVVD